ncbi:transporter, LysE family [Campylobacter iguaniorum]|uniref:LysE family translocator n=1 Tax=Campylobacter iguaniorum TaxID=1244531 RepID=UPI00073A5090|nr:LysE family translocator [Campylobacter iguaniorum]ALV24499.1 transporter, LysE family [Campylobacter iguaniorum]
MDWMLFTTSFFLAALSPGLNMIMALTVGLSAGYKKAFLFILTSTVSLAAIVFLSGVGIGFLITKFPIFFTILKIFGAFYLFFIAYKMFTTTKLQTTNIDASLLSTKAIVFQGFVSAFGDPIIWGFMISLLPKFMDINDPFNGTFAAFIIIIACIEFVATNIYAIGGSGVKRFFSTNFKIINKISATMFGLLGVWMLFEVIK